MNEQALLRYSRQLLLSNFDVNGQLSLSNKRAVIVGAGGLGNIAATYLVGAGVGSLVLIDDDCVDLSNLPRQVLYSEADIDQPKVLAAQAQLQVRNPSVEIIPIQARLNAENVSQYLADADVILDCCDNFDTRRLVHRWAQQHQCPLVSGAAIRWEGQLVTFRYDQTLSPCYECLYPDLSDQQLSCNVNGIIGPVVGTIGVQQALVALKLLSGTGQVKHGVLQLFDGLGGDWRSMRLSQDPDCPNCRVEKS
ncbi:HesA/MoeB/ThiF family protein [Marinomonas ostreistagni]|uniref:HesA/MoeB/ThiF family protein n=1 Tax=Marinomonas ostreistagni TaxID=359209 RepID=UPI00194DBDD3|nr:HesA/MoeB/ThiF family protein [Marinomonas ostreistagni]MBM6551726.1 HesA/MoeB/ThiF family protein [Marinomonas ostreistagni]